MVGAVPSPVKLQAVRSEIPTKALPPLVEKSVERGWRTVIQSGTLERRDALNDILWTWSEESFLAHATDDSPDAADTPIILTTGETNPNGANVRFLVDGADLPDFFLNFVSPGYCRQQA